MTQKQAATIESACERAAKENIRIVGKGTLTATGARFFIVSSKNYATTGRAYIVSIGEDHRLHCNCQATDICKHTAVTHAALKAEVEARIVRAPERKEAAQSIALGNCEHCSGTYAIVSDVPHTQQGLCDGCLDDQQQEYERQNAQDDAEAQAIMAQESEHGDLLRREPERTPVEYVGPYEYTKQQHAIEVESMGKRAEAAILATDNRAFSIYK
jgi:hypothetical protein